jgi:hypothetical protein
MSFLICTLSPNIIRMIKSRGMRWAGSVTPMGNELPEVYKKQGNSWLADPLLVFQE